MRKCSIVIAVFVTFITGSHPFALGRHVSASEFVKDVNILFLKGDYAGLVRDVESNMESYRFSRRKKKEVLYLTGVSYLKLKDYRKAREVFENILKMKGSRFREDAYIGIADSYFLEKKYDKAIQAYEGLLTMYPRSNRVSGIYKNLGFAYQERNLPEKADLYYRRVKQDYKDSFEADVTTYVTKEDKQVYYIIQLGAFQSLRNAKRLVRQLTRKRHDSYVQKVTKDGKILYRVRGGKFSNKDYAERLLRRLKRDGFSAKIIEE